jgi:Leucine-rich repeat (LRR) protein
MRGTGEISASIGNLTSLWILSLNQNQLTGAEGVDPAIHLCKSMRVAGEIPASIGNLTSLTKLTFSRNQLSGA